MTRINTLDSIAAAPAAAQPLLNKVQAQLGKVPNLFRVIANSPAALEGYLSLNTALAGGALDAQTRERVALTVAELNGCSYCLSAHTYLAKNIAKLDDAEISANRNGASKDPKADAAVRFAAQLVRAHGQVSDSDVAAVKAAGYGDAEIVEIVAHVALNTLTNFINETAKTEIDFPQIRATKAA